MLQKYLIKYLYKQLLINNNRKQGKTFLLYSNIFNKLKLLENPKIKILIKNKFK